MHYKSRKDECPLAFLRIGAKGEGWGGVGAIKQKKIADSVIMSVDVK